MKKYQIENSIGNGNFSTVYHAKEIASQKPCAIKIMKTHKKIALREATLLKKFKHPNVITLLDFQQNEHQSWIVLEQAGMNTLQLYENHKHGLREEQVKCILFQAALGLAYVHSFGVIHRDVKPENLLIDKKTASVKIIDFGLAIEQSGVSTDYIATRWYRAPQNLLGTKQYTCAIDVFSLGCVIVQLYLGSPLFPGANNLDQILKIFSILGYPNADDWALGYKKMVDTGLKQSSSSREKQMDLRQILHPCDAKLISLLIRMLTLNPKKRISCTDIIKHEYFRDIRSIIPPNVYNRYEQDYMTKKPLNFKGVGQQKHPRLNLNTKYLIPQISGANLGFLNGSQKNKLHMHKSTEHHFINQNTILRTKKSTSTDSIKSFYSQKQSLNSVINEQKNLTENQNVLEGNKTLEVFKLREEPSNLSLVNQQSLESQASLKESMPYEPSIQQIKKSQTSTGDSTRNQPSIVIPNIPTVQIHMYCEPRRYSTTMNEQNFIFSHRSPPSIIRSHQQQPLQTSSESSNFSFMENMKKLSVGPQGQRQNYNYSRNDQSKDKSFQGERLFPRFQSKINPSCRRNRINPVVSGNANQSGSFRMPFSPQHHFQGLNLYRNIHNPNTRRPEEATPRAYCSPTIHHFQSPPPKTLTNRKNTIISPPHQNQRLYAKSPDNGPIYRGNIISPQNVLNLGSRNMPAGFLPVNNRPIKM